MVLCLTENFEKINQIIEIPASFSFQKEFLGKPFKMPLVKIENEHEAEAE
ncbi:MAG: hypothetical protein PHW04_16960 [Candidatus Wallbacteria bacterium]|nr:hypothetical protein [Candidatus Wallbacteria bacterium]